MTQTDKQAHTPGPWAHRNDLIFRARGEEVPPELFWENDVATMTGPSKDRREANARRIVAAVNACEGIPTEALEASVVTDLLAACELLIEMGPPYYSNVASKARAAIAKAKGVSP